MIKCIDLKQQSLIFTIPIRFFTTVTTRTSSPSLRNNQNNLHFRDKDSTYLFWDHEFQDIHSQVPSSSIHTHDHRSHFHYCKIMSRMCHSERKLMTCYYFHPHRCMTRNTLLVHRSNVSNQRLSCRHQYCRLLHRMSDHSNRHIHKKWPALCIQSIHLGQNI